MDRYVRRTSFFFSLHSCQWTCSVTPVVHRPDDRRRVLLGVQVRETGLKGPTGPQVSECSVWPDPSRSSRGRSGRVSLPRTAPHSPTPPANTPHDRSISPESRTIENKSTIVKWENSVVRWNFFSFWDPGPSDNQKKAPRPKGIRDDSGKGTPRSGVLWPSWTRPYE